MRRFLQIKASSISITFYRIPYIRVLDVVFAQIADCLPFFSFLGCAFAFLAIGTSTVISYEIGLGNSREADRYFGQGTILAGAMGLGLSLAFWLTYSLLPDFYGVTGELARDMRDYFLPVCFLPPTALLGALFRRVLINEGREKLALFASVSDLVAGTALSVALVPVLGIKGASIGVVTGSALRAVLCAAVFISGGSQRRFRLFASGGAVLRMARYGIVDASILLYVSLTPFCVNLFLLDRFGGTGCWCIRRFSMS